MHKHNIVESAVCLYIYTKNRQKLLSSHSFTSWPASPNGISPIYIWTIQSTNQNRTVSQLDGNLLFRQSNSIEAIVVWAECVSCFFFFLFVLRFFESSLSSSQHTASHTQCVYGLCTEKKSNFRTQPVEWNREKKGREKECELSVFAFKHHHQFQTNHVVARHTLFYLIMEKKHKKKIYQRIQLSIWQTKQKRVFACCKSTAAKVTLLTCMVDPTKDTYKHLSEKTKTHFAAEHKQKEFTFKYFNIIYLLLLLQ